MMLRCAAALMALAVATAGCASDGTGKASADATAGTGNSAAATGGTGSGISADEAKRKGVFVGAYDAKLQRPQQQGGRITISLVNVGTKDDRYRLHLEPASAGSVTPSEVAVAAGKSVAVVVQLAAPASLRVVSDGRAGAEVTDASLAPR